MAKKSYTKIKNLFYPNVKESGPEDVVIKFTGQNKAGTDCEVSVTIEEYMMPHLITEFAKIGKKRLERANRNMDSIKSAINIL